jgi:hypothetical protein
MSATPNQAHSVDAPIARRFHFGHHWRRATDAHRSAAEGVLMDERAWPFPILKPEAEWAAFELEYIGLLRAAYA